MQSRKELGKLFANARIAQGLSQTKAAALLGIGRTTLSNYEIGVSEPSLLDGLHMCKLYGLDPSALLDMTSEQLGLPLGKEPRLHGNRYTASEK